MTSHLRNDTFRLAQIQFLGDIFVVTDLQQEWKGSDSHLQRCTGIAVFRLQRHELLLHTCPGYKPAVTLFDSTYADLSAMNAVWNIRLLNSVSTGSTILSIVRMEMTH